LTFWLGAGREALSAVCSVHRIEYFLRTWTRIGTPRSFEALMSSSTSRISKWLDRAPMPVMNGYAVAAAFAAYFCMYAFRKPFTGATYDGLAFAGTQIELKTALVVSQIIGYTLSKFLGIKVCSETDRGNRLRMLILLILCAEAALVLFAIAPTQWKVAAIFLNGLPLGMVWGLVVRYLEGRRTSDMLLAGLACSFIVSSGAVKDVGRALMAGDSVGAFGVGIPNPLPPFSEYWMPAATGLVFLGPFLLAVWLLDRVPEPTRGDIIARTEREPMNHKRRGEYFVQYFAGLVLIILAYVLLTAFRDYRDNYAVEILDQLGYAYSDNKYILSRMELGVAAGVLIAMGLMSLIKSNRSGLLVAFLMILAGFVIVGVASLLRDLEIISGLAWMGLVGLGSYVAYVPFNTVLFDRLLASTRFVGTAVFGIYLADSAGYSGSILLQLGKDVFAGPMTRLEFLRDFAWVLSVAGSILMFFGCLYFWRRAVVDRMSSELINEAAPPPESLAQSCLKMSLRTWPNEPQI
jgi:hypothetical protein